MIKISNRIVEMSGDSKEIVVELAYGIIGCYEQFKKLSPGSEFLILEAVDIGLNHINKIEGGEHD